MVLADMGQIDTPALLIDLDAVERNINVMISFLSGKKLKLRPHFKSVKVPEIALMQLEAGAKGITCAKLSEAEVLADAGVTDILLANQIVTPLKLERLANLAGRVPRMAVAVDTVNNVQELNDACAQADTSMHVFVELDVGLGRCGVRTYEEGLVVSKAVVDAPNLVFEGIQAYEGHLVLKPDIAVRKNGVEQLLSYVEGFKNHLENHGVPVNEVSGSGTGTHMLTGIGDIYTELQAGSYIYMDTRYAGLGLPFEFAQYILSTVISKQPGVAILDVGLKSISTDNGAPLVVGFERCNIKLSEEHCKLDDPEGRLKVNDTAVFIPSHCCTTINLYDVAYGIRGGSVERIFEIKGRGKSQ